MADENRYHPVGTPAAVISAVGSLLLALWLLFVAGLLSSPSYGAGPMGRAASTLMLWAVLSCLVAFISIVLALAGRNRPVLYPLAGAALLLAAVLCVLAREEWLAIPCVILALLTPWWSVLPPRSRLAAGLVAGFVAVLMLLVGVRGYTFMAEVVKRASPDQPPPIVHVCEEIPLEVIARLEGSMTVPGGVLMGAKAVHSRANPSLWFLAAEVQGEHYPGENDIGIWLVDEQGTSDPGTLDAADPIYTVNQLAAQISDLPPKPTFEGSREAAATCTREALAAA